MSFIHRNFYNTDSSFTPLIRLLEDFDAYSQGGGGGNQHGGRRTAVPTVHPKFDIRETAKDYELHGELPGMNKENVNIEFIDPQTMVVRGRVERTYSAGSPPAGHIEDVSASGAITQGDEGKSSHRATVEDEDADANKSQTSTSQEVEKRSGNKQPTDKAKYWLTERSVGEFSRCFNFPSRIEQDGVTANFKDGILSIKVPKAKKHESRRIAIN